MWYAGVRGVRTLAQGAVDVTVDGIGASAGKMAPLQRLDAGDALATAPALAFVYVIPAEPDVVYPEAHFENAVLALIRDNAPAAHNFALIPRFGGLDVAIFTRDAERTNAAFLEIKSFGGQRQGGIGFGRSQGEGPQIDFLISPPQLAIFDSHVRWAFADATLPRGSARYALLNCTQAREAAMGGVARGKQNNFRVSALRVHNVMWLDFCAYLLQFLRIAEAAM